MSCKSHRINSLLTQAMPLIQNLLNIGNVGFVGSVLIFYFTSYVSYKSYVSYVRYLMANYKRMNQQMSHYLFNIMVTKSSVGFGSCLVRV
jgi:hypothetical protein